MFNPETGSREPEEEIPQQELPVIKKGDKINDEGIDLEQLGKEIKTEAGKLDEKLLRRTFSEKHFSEVSTRKAKVHRQGADVEQQERPQPERQTAFRFERGQIYKAYRILRKEIQAAEKRGEETLPKTQLLRELHKKAKALEKDLDELATQAFENVQNVEIKTSYGDFTIPVCKFDLRKDIDSKDDKRKPTFIVGGITTQHHQDATSVWPPALNGEIVYALTFPEHPTAQKPEDYFKTLLKQKDFKMHAEIVKQVIEKLGLKEVNLAGYSTGASIATELATDTSFDKINDLTILEPLGFENKGLAKLGWEFVVKQIFGKSLPSAETRAKGLNQGMDQGGSPLHLFGAVAKILSGKMFSPEELKKIHNHGRLQLGVATASPIVNVEATESAFQRAEAAGGHPVEIYEIQKGDHFWPVNQAFGAFGLMNGEKPKEQVTKVSSKDLKNSAITQILKDVK